MPPGTDGELQQRPVHVDVRIRADGRAVGWLSLRPRMRALCRSHARTRAERPRSGRGGKRIGQHQRCVASGRATPRCRTRRSRARRRRRGPWLHRPLCCRARGGARRRVGDLRRHRPGSLRHRARTWSHRALRSAQASRPVPDHRRRQRRPRRAPPRYSLNGARRHLHQYSDLLR
jgi:hypothetical protein